MTDKNGIMSIDNGHKHCNNTVSRLNFKKTHKCDYITPILT